MLRYWPPLAHLAFLAAVVLVVLQRAGHLPERMGTASEPANGEQAELPMSAVFPLPEQTDPAAMLDMIAAWPLFGAAPDRAAAPAPEPEAETDDAANEPATEPDLAVQMVGFAEAGGERRALVATGDGTSEVWVKKGDVVSGWTIVAIRSDQVTLRQGSREMAVNMFR